MNSLELVPIADLIARFENDIRYGCHSTLVEVNRSQAGKDLMGRSEKEEIIRALHVRWKEMGEQNLDDVGKSVRNGIAMLIEK
jgi:hypothetical protein